MVLDHRLDVLAWNPPAASLLIDFGTVPVHRRNTTWQLFLNPDFQARYPYWDEVARQNVAFLRASAGRHPGDARIAELVSADRRTQREVPYLVGVP